jgi:hypothetical protein
VLIVGLPLAVQQNVVAISAMTVVKVETPSAAVLKLAVQQNVVAISAMTVVKVETPSAARLNLAATSRVPLLLVNPQEPPRKPKNYTSSLAKFALVKTPQSASKN